MQRDKCLKPKVTLRAALSDPQLLDLDADSWIAWPALLHAMMGESPERPELEHFRKLTRRAEPPRERAAEFCGRGRPPRWQQPLLAVYLAALCAPCVPACPR